MSMGDSRVSGGGEIGGSGAPGVDEPDEVDPKVAELVVTIRDRFGLRGLRGARWMIDQEIALAEDAMGELDPGRGQP